MTLQEITACFPSIKDWEDSYFKEPTSGQRLLGVGGGCHVEIILETELRKVAFIFDSVTDEMLSCLNLFSGGRLKSLEYLRSASAFVGRNPNTPYQRIFEGCEVTMTQIRDSKKMTNSLVIQPVSGLSSHPQK